MEITEEWLKKHGFTWRKDHLFRGHMLEYCGGNMWFLHSWGNWLDKKPLLIPGPRTTKECRDLCQMLGI